MIYGVTFKTKRTMKNNILNFNRLYMVYNIKVCAMTYKETYHFPLNWMFTSKILCLGICIRHLWVFGKVGQQTHFDAYVPYTNLDMHLTKPWSITFLSFTWRNFKIATDPIAIVSVSLYFQTFLKTTWFHPLFTCLNNHQEMILKLWLWGLARKQGTDKTQKNLFDWKAH